MRENFCEQSSQARTASRLGGERDLGDWGKMIIFADMKRAFYLIAIIIGGILTARGEAEAEPEVPFAPQVTEMLMAYGKTAKPMLPELENMTEIDCPTSVAPGRMRLPRHIVVDKPKMQMMVVNMFGDTLIRRPVCASAKRGQKKSADDWRTPEGTFKIYGVYNSTDWTYKDTQDKCYGPFFIAVLTPRFYGIGLHGTNAPGSVPGRRSHGCMRMHNEDITVVRRMVDKDSRVIIMPDPVADSYE